MGREPTHMEIDERDERVLRVIYEQPAPGVANPYLIRENTGIGKGDVNTSLNRLARLGYVTQVTRGLYELTEKGENFFSS